MKNLLIIDFQNDFITGSLAVPNADLLIKNINKLNLSIFNMIGITLDMHPYNHCSFKENGGLWPKHCIKNTDGVKLESLLAKKIVNTFGNIKNAHVIIFEKGTLEDKEEYSFLQNKPCLKQFIESFKKEDELYIGGIAGDFCVHDTIIDLIKLGYEHLVVIDDLIASIDGGKKLKQLIQKENLRTTTLN